MASINSWHQHFGFWDPKNEDGGPKDKRPQVDRLVLDDNGHDDDDDGDGGGGGGGGECDCDCYHSNYGEDYLDADPEKEKGERDWAERNILSEYWRPIMSWNGNKQKPQSEPPQQLTQLMAHRQQLKQQRKEIQECLSHLKSKLVLMNESGHLGSLTARGSGNQATVSRVFNGTKTGSKSQRIKILRQEYLKHGGQNQEVLEQMKSMEIGIKLKGDKNETAKEKSRKTQEQRLIHQRSTQGQRSTHEQRLTHQMSTGGQRSTHQLFNRKTNKSMEEEDSSMLRQEISRLESENQSLQFQLDMILPHYSKESPTEKKSKQKHQLELLLLQEKIEIVKKQKELKKHKKELQEILDEEKRPKQIMNVPRRTSSRYLLPSSPNKSIDLNVHCDFISGLPPDIVQCHIILHLFSESSMLKMEGIPLSPVTCTVKTKPSDGIYRNPLTIFSSDGFAFIGKKQSIPRDFHCPNLYLILEFQVHKNAITTSTSGSAECFEDYFQTQAWTRIALLDRHHHPIEGKFFVPLKILPIIAKMSNSQFESLPQFWKAKFYYQIGEKDIELDKMATFDKHSYKPFYKVSSFSPKIKFRSPPPPPPPPRSSDSPSNLEDPKYYSFRSPDFVSDSSAIDIRVILYCIKGAKPLRSKLCMRAFHPTEQKVVECRSGPLTLETEYMDTSFRYGYHMFGNLEIAFQGVNVHKSILIVAKFYQLQKKSENSTLEESEKISLQENFVAWTVLPLLKIPKRGFIAGHKTRSAAAALNTGPHALSLYCPPIPSLLDLMKTEAGRKWTKYGEATLFMDVVLGIDGPAPESPNLEDNLLVNQRTLKENFKFCYIFVEKQESSTKTEAFTAESGFDIYLDSCRFLPDSVSFTRIAGRIIDRHYKKYAADISAVAKLNSDIFNPVFEHKEEIREPNPPVSATLLLKVYSKNPDGNGLIVMGFTALNLFVELDTNQQPTVTRSGLQVSLNEGAFQLRLYSRGPDYVSPMSVDYFTEHNIAPIPCATVLVRICKPPKNHEGQVLSSKEIPKDEWQEFGVWVEAPRYNDAVYVSTSCIPTFGERQLFSFLCKRPIQRVADVARKILKDKSMNERLNASTTNMTKYIKNQLFKGLEETPVNVDLNQISKYQPELGIKVAIDAANNLPWSGFTLAHICLNPPASFYKKTFPYGVDKLKFVEEINLEQSAISSPVWNDGFKSFPSRSFHPYLSVILHLREIRVKLTNEESYKFSLLEEAWTVFPVFSKHYAITEPFQLPLFYGKPSIEFLDQLNSQPCQKCIRENILKHKIVKLDNASVFVRLCDGRRSDELPFNVYIHEQIPVNRSYLSLSKHQDSFPENPAVPIDTLIPAHRDSKRFLQAIANMFKELVLKEYESEIET